MYWNSPVRLFIFGLISYAVRLRTVVHLRHMTDSFIFLSKTKNEKFSRPGFFFSIKNPHFAGNEMNSTTVAKIVKYFLIFFRHQLRGSSLVWKHLELKSMQLPVDSLDCPSKGTYLKWFLNLLPTIGPKSEVCSKRKSKAKLTNFWKLSNANLSQNLIQISSWLMIIQSSFTFCCQCRIKMPSLQLQLT